MGKWSVWTKAGKGDDILITQGLTEKQARDILEHLRLICRDFEAFVEED